jgi:hypothetical protein
MFTPKQLLKALKLGEPSVNAIAEEVFEKTEYELKLEHAETTWSYPFTLGYFKELKEKKEEIIFEQLQEINGRLQAVEDTFYAELGISTKCCTFVDSFSSEETDGIMTHFMHDYMPSTKPHTFSEFSKIYETHIESQKVPVIEYIKKTVIPLIGNVKKEENSPKRQKMIKA